VAADQETPIDHLDRYCTDRRAKGRRGNSRKIVEDLFLPGRVY